MTIEEASAAIADRRVSSAELTRACLDRIERRNPELNAFLTVTAKAALKRAEEMDGEIADGIRRGPLHGIPIAHKDNVSTRGVRTTSGAKIFADHVPEVDAEIVWRLEHAGAVMLGKTGMHELAYGITSVNPHYGPIRNPHDPARIAGGSSGGSAAAVADGMCLLATGTDTGGSLRIPASFCGVVGVKPTYGLVSRDGIQPLGLTLDHVGPLAATVRDAATALALMSGREFNIEHEPSLAGLMIGMPENFFFDDVDPEVSHAVKRAAEAFIHAGAHIEHVVVPDMDLLNLVSRTITLAEAAAIFEPWAGQRADLGDDVLALLEQGRMLPATAYVNAQRLRAELIGAFRGLLETVDFLLTPATPTPAPLVEAEADIRLATTRLVRGINVIGFPALAMPCGKTQSGLPIGLQLVAAPWRDAELFNAAAALEDMLSTG
ncbi:MAG: amidase [Bryobacteraceae bacterium]|jgi:aspartyl-tRNA(Asn)/glutamyl-tRNA(Gln) amidotransferase subunit A